MSEAWFAQNQHTVRLDWGDEGARRAAERQDLVVIVDVLRFSTAVAAGVAAGVPVAPTEWRGNPEQKALLSPAVLAAQPVGQTVVLPSPNGARCSLAAASAPGLWVGALVNARAVAAAVRAELDRGTAAAVTVVACGERWPDGSLRFALEDLLGAGAVIAALAGLPSSPEAKAGRAAFLGARKQLTQRLMTCGSGIELIDKGHTADVAFAAQLDHLAVAPRGNAGVYFSASTHSGDTKTS